MPPPREGGHLRPAAGASGDEQTVNARLVERAGGGVLLPQDSLTPERLLDAVKRLLADPTALHAMGCAAQNLAMPDAAQRIAQLVCEVAAPDLNRPSTEAVRPA